MGTVVDVPLVVEDARVPENCVAGRLHVRDGTGAIVAGAAEPRSVRLAANGLAALYAGTPTAALAAAGLLSGGSASEHAMLDAAFAGRPAYMLDAF
jgi:hypothetical protein